MKTLWNFIRLTFVIFITTFALGCNRSKAPETVTIPFSGEALGEYMYAGPDTLPNPKCTDSLSAWRAIVEGKGASDQLGSFTAYFDFCGDTLNHYGNLYGYLVAENGDTLFVNGSGQVIAGRLAEHPEDVISYWRDDFEITGGTGKYMGATGTIMSDDYNTSSDAYSHHHWSGTLTLLKEKK